MYIGATRQWCIVRIGLKLRAMKRINTSLALSVFFSLRKTNTYILYEWGFSFSPLTNRVHDYPSCHVIRSHAHIRDALWMQLTSWRDRNTVFLWSLQDRHRETMHRGFHVTSRRFISTCSLEIHPAQNYTQDHLLQSNSKKRQNRRRGPKIIVALGRLTVVWVWIQFAPLNPSVCERIYNADMACQICVFFKCRSRVGVCSVVRCVGKWVFFQISLFQSWSNVCTLQPFSPPHRWDNLAYIW